MNALFRGLAGIASRGPEGCALWAVFLCMSNTTRQLEGVASPQVPRGITHSQPELALNDQRIGVERVFVFRGDVVGSPLANQDLVIAALRSWSL